MGTTGSLGSKMCAALLLCVVLCCLQGGQVSSQQHDDTWDHLLVSLREKLDAGTADLLGRFSDARQGSRGLDSEIDVPWYSSASHEDDNTAREVLEVTSVRKDNNFSYGVGVQKWISLSVGSTIFVVGLRPNGVTLLTASLIAPDIGSGQTYSLTETKFETHGTPLAASLFKHWNSEKKVLEGILVLAVDSPGHDVTWYRLGVSGLETITSWPILKPVRNLKVFEVGGQYKLLLVTHCDAVLEKSCVASAKIYDFSLSSFEPKLSQTLPLDGLAASVEVGSVGDSLYLALALPEVGVVKIYHYHSPSELERKSSGNTTCGWFEFWRDINSPGVAHAIFFHVSYKMYLAVGGTRPAILRFVSPTQVEGCPNALHGLGAVFGWMILPVQTYRDEVVVLAEVADPRMPHKRTVLSLTWGGVGVFRLSDPPCQLKDGAHDSCLIDSYAIGLNGAVALELGDASVVTILMPRGEGSSALFRLYTQLQPILNPLLWEVSLLDQAKIKLEMELARQEVEMRATDEMLKHTLRTDGSNTITANWVVQEVFTPEHEENRPDVQTAAYPGLDDLKASFEEVSSLVKQLLHYAADAAVFDGKAVYLSGSSNLIGGVDISGHTVLDTLSVNQLNGELVSSLLEETVKIDEVNKIGGLKTLTEVEAFSLDFATINDIPQDELIFDVPNKPIVVDGKLFLSEPLHVVGDIDLPLHGTVNTIDISEEVFQVGKLFEGTPHIEHVTVEGDLTVDVVNTIEMHPHSLRTIVTGHDWLSSNGSVYDNFMVTGNIQVERVNGYVWNDIVKRIVWKDKPDHIDGLTIVDGVLRSESKMSIWQLNNLSFPEDFVLRTVDNQHISALKEFRGHIFVGNVDVGDTVDGVPLQSLITIHTHQELDGVLKLNEADIYGDVKVNWGINGISFDQIVNRSAFIGQGKVVSSNVDFSGLEVEGHILVSNTVDGLSLKEFLDDLVSLPQDETDQLEIKCRKVLKGGLIVNGPGISISSGSINDINLLDFARVDIPQAFKGVKAVEHVVFGDLHLSGLWDGVDIVELNADTVRLEGNQDSSASLSFSPSSELWASQLIILGHLNTEIPRSALENAGNICDQQSTPGVDCIINGPVAAHRVNIQGELTILGKICDKNLNDFESRRLSRSRPQVVEGAMSFGSMYIENHLQITYINDVPIQIIGIGIPPPAKFNWQNALWNGDLAVDDLFIEGNIESHNGVNQFDIAYISENAVKLYGDNIFTKDLSFENMIHVDALVGHGRLSDQNFAFLIHDTVSKHDLDHVSISGVKVFYAGLNVEGTIITPKLSGLTTSKIITKSSPFALQGPLRVEGSVHGGNILLSGLLNKLPVSTFLNRYKLSPEGRHTLRGNIRFAPEVSINELFVIGRINGVMIDDFFRSVVLKADPTVISGNKLFINKVTFKDITVQGLVNNISLRDFANDVILANDEEEVVVDGRVTFMKKLVANKGVDLSENLEAAELDGCLVKEWFDNAIYLNQVTSIGGVKKFSNISAHSDLRLSTLNAVDMSKIITLNQPQVIPTDMNIVTAGVQHNLEVHGRVNGIHLPTEYENTLLIKSNQRVLGEKTFLSGIKVEGNIASKGLISGKNLSNAVTLYSVQTVTGPMKFQSIVIDGNLHVDGLISDIDVRRWKDRAFLRKSLYPQVVSGQWKVLGNVRFTEEVGGGGLLDGEDVHALAQEVDRARKSAVEIQSEIKVGWTELCKETNALLEKARAQPFLFQQLEVVQAIPSPLTSSMHVFEAGEEQFLVVSFAFNCSGAVYHWNGERTSWELMNVALQNIGAIERWASFRNSSATYLITSTGAGAPNCPFSGGNVWRFGPGLQLRNIHSMEPWHEALVDESRGHFYTLGGSGVSAWQIQDGTVTPLNSWAPGMTDRARFVPPSLGMGLSLSDGQWLTVLSRSQEQIASEQPMVRSANPFLPSRDKGSVAVMEVSNGRKVVAVAQDDSDVLVVYDDVSTGRTLGTVRAHQAHSLSVLELSAPGRHGQTLLAFVEDERILRVVQYKGVQGFVDVTEAKLAVAVKEMIPVRLQARGLVNPRHFLLLRSDYKVLLLELEMTGDPLDESSLYCNL